MFLGNKNVTDHSRCMAIRQVLSRVGDKWSLLIISTLAPGAHRFNELKRGIEGISQRMLTATLRELERDGLVTRTVTPSVPPRVDYALTDLGRTLIESVQALTLWADAHRGEIQRAQERFDRRQARA